MTAAAAETLEVERSGGFGGLTLRASVPLAQLSPRERAAIEECFRHPSAPPSGPDRFVYRFRMHGHEADVQEDQVPVELRPLLDRLTSSWR
ncbi:MAG TPA: protealysin inhibitor emfourin [Candidatus Dormibacteraeota bacterium]